MKPIFLLQFTCLVFMVINALVLGIMRLHVRWNNKRYEQSRWMLVAATIGFAIQYLIQMLFGFRAQADDLGAVVNILIYTPCFSLFSLAIYNIEAIRPNYNRLLSICGAIYVAIIAVFAISVSINHSLNIGVWLYVMMALFLFNEICCIYIIVQVMRKRQEMLESLAANDMLPYVRYSRASLAILFLASIVVPFAIISSKLLLIIGPFALLSVLFFNLSFVALGSSYTPTEELLDKDSTEKATVDTLEQASSNERTAVIEQRLQQWCQQEGYKDSSVNMMTLSRMVNVPKDELTTYFDQSLKSTFRIWLSDIRFNAAKKMMLDNPDYSNDIISAECGFSSRTHLYRIFKLREGCTPTAWRENQTAK